MRTGQGIFLGMGLFAVLVGAWLGTMQSPVAGPGTTAYPVISSAVSSDLTVHVSGWVVSPGVVVVAEGSIVAEAVAAAGGARSGALLDRINLSRPVEDGDLIEVPGPESSGSDSVSGAVGSVDGLVSINRATATELETLPGVGPVLAGRIVQHREDHGHFETAEDLLDVTGIGEAKLASIRDLIKVP